VSIACLAWPWTVLTEGDRYFIHGDYAGISAFVNRPAGESHRNAQMRAIGVLVPLSYGRLGKSWLHAEGLQDLARYTSYVPPRSGLVDSHHWLRQQIPNGDLQNLLEDFWEKNKITEEPTEGASPESSPDLRSRPTKKQVNGYRRPRAISDATVLISSNQVLSAHHPAISLPSFLGDFGPLVFPLYRAALLRKRILIVGDAPVQQNCNFGTNHLQFTTSPSCPQSPTPSYPSYPSMAYRPSVCDLFSTLASQTSQNCPHRSPLRRHLNLVPAGSHVLQMMS
jgi:DENN domain-containing protein 11